MRLIRFSSIGIIASGLLELRTYFLFIIPRGNPLRQRNRHVSEPLWLPAGDQGRLVSVTGGVFHFVTFG